MLDCGSHLRCRPEETIRRHRAPDPLVRATEVVRLHEETHASLAVLEVRENRPRQKLVPKRLPEALGLAQRLRVVRAALDVVDPLAAKLLLEVRLAAPGDVLTALIGQHLARRSVLRNPSRERLEHER